MLPEENGTGAVEPHGKRDQGDHGHQQKESQRRDRLVLDRLYNRPPTVQRLGGEPNEAYATRPCGWVVGKGMHIGVQHQMHIDREHAQHIEGCS